MKDKNNTQHKILTSYTTQQFIQKCQPVCPLWSLIGLPHVAELEAEEVKLESEPEKNPSHRKKQEQKLNEGNIN